MSDTASGPTTALPPPPPWGALRAPLLPRACIALSRAVPPWPVVKQLSFLLRRMARAGIDGLVDAELWGHRLRFTPRGNISEGFLLYMPSRWDPEEREVVARFVRPGAVFMDVGCNFGGYTWWLLHLLGHRCRVVAMEPDPGLYRRLHFNLATNGWENVTVLPWAAGAEDGVATLRVHPTNLGQSALLEAAAEDSAQEAAEGAAVAPAAHVQVPVRSLAAVAEAQRVERIDVMKVDIEGLEPPVLRAFLAQAPRALWPRLLICERADTPEHDALHHHLEGAGYRTVRRTRLNMVLRLPD